MKDRAAYNKWRETVVKMFAVVCEPLPEERDLIDSFARNRTPREVLDSTIEETEE